ncbi:MAG: hypothetical protein FWE29_02085 [Defluviitaleaceae bacterium]|nr:hypothetical protein [Defluviitaleaceae bacterium]
MFSTKKIKDCDRFKAVNQSQEIQEMAEMGCRSCKFFKNRNCSLETAGEIDPMPGMWS